MARSHREIDRLRAEARARHRAATRKVSRLHTQHGVELSGTKADPRRDLAKIKTYNSRQLKAYIRELNQFTSRRTQYVADANRRPVQSELWQRYKRLETQYNKRVASEFAKYSSIFVPRLGMTIGERMAMMTPDHRQMGNPAVNAPYAPPVRKPSNLASKRALERLIADMENRLSPEFFKRQIAEGREQYERMAQIINEPELADAVKKLTDEQFSVLWNYTPFATAESLRYEIRQAELSNKERPWHNDITAQAAKDSHALIEWARSLDLGR